MSSFIREFLYKAHIFLIRQIIPGHVSNFPRETFLTPLFFMPLYSHEYTFYHCCTTPAPQRWWLRYRSTREPPPLPQNVPLLAELCRIQRGSHSHEVGHFEIPLTKEEEIALSLCEDVCPERRGPDHSPALIACTTPTGAFAPPQKLVVNLYTKEVLSVVLFCAIL